jgi:hypothetical protein
MNYVKAEIERLIAEAAALEREPVQPGEDIIGDRADRRWWIKSRFDAALVEACAPGYTGVGVSNVIADRARLDEWWHQYFGKEIVEDSLIDAMLCGIWTDTGWPEDMIDGAR